MENVKEQFSQMINNWSLSSYCTVLQAPSQQIARLIPSIDFLHIDGNFSEEGALSDTLLYLPKVKPGGYILLSNLCMMINNKATKAKALWPLFDQCKIVGEIDNGNSILFQVTTR